MADKKLSALTELTAPAADDKIYIVETSAGTAGSKYIQLGSLFIPTIAQQVNVSKNFTYPGEPAVSISGSGTNSTAPEGLLELVNPSDGTGADDYASEVHLYMRAGATGNRRKYINFRKYDDTADELIIGCNASDTWIVYDGTIHRIWFEQDGASYINAAGSAVVAINYHATDTTSTGGLNVYSGGTPANNNLIFKAATNTATPDSQTNVTVNAGKTTAQNGLILFQDRGTLKLGFGKHSTNGFMLYDYINSMYALWWDTATPGLAVGHSVPAAMLHPIKIDTGTNAVVNVGILGHSTSGTPDAGFGTGLLFQAEDASVDNRSMGRLTFAWVTATDASRAARGTLTAYSTTTEQTVMQWDGDAGGVKLGFRGSAPVAKETVTGSRGSNAALADLLTKLVNLGLITDGTS